MSKSCQGLFRDYVKCLRETECMKVRQLCGRQGFVACTSDQVL